MSERDIEVAAASKGTTGSGRNVIAVIGIDHYHHWQSLSNAVCDATGAAALFQRLGFEEVTAPLLDGRATGKALQSLVTDDLMALGPEDSLVLFYAGHGGTRKHRLGDKAIKTGYLIPADAASSPDKVSTWVELEGWLRAVALLPAKHILVVLDACHSGIALDPIIKWRDIGTWQDTPLATLRARRSRRIITSALDDQVALDSGPVHGHSLFTGCLIEGLTDGIAQGGNRVTTGSELGLYVQRRVQTYPHARQTPDFGTFAFDDRGEMVIPLAIEPVIEPPEQPAMEAGLPAWLDLIDLDDKTAPASESELQPSNAVFGTEGEVSSAPISIAESDLAPPDGRSAQPAPAFDAGARPDDADVGVVADDVAAHWPKPGSAPPALEPTASPSPKTVVAPPSHVASIVLNPELAELGTAESVQLQTSTLQTASLPPSRLLKTILLVAALAGAAAVLSLRHGASPTPPTLPGPPAQDAEVVQGASLEVASSPVAGAPGSGAPGAEPPGAGSAGPVAPSASPGAVPPVASSGDAGVAAGADRAGPPGAAGASGSDAGVAAGSSVGPGAGNGSDSDKSERIVEAKNLYEKAHNAFDWGDYQRAFELADASLKLRKTARTYLLRAQAEYRLDRVAEALASVDAAAMIAPEFSSVWETRGRILWAVGRRDDARGAFEKFLALEPTGAKAAAVQRLLNEQR